MDKQLPQKRRSIHKNAPIDEITDNVKNNAIIMTRSKSRQLNKKQETENNLSNTSSSDDSEEELVLHRRSFENNVNSINYKLRQKESYSEEITDEDELENEYNCISASYTIKNKQGSTSSKEANRSADKTKQTVNDNESNNFNWKRLISFFILIIVLLGGLYMTEDGIASVTSTKRDMGTQTDDVKSILNDVKATLKNLQLKYKNQDENLWADAYATIASIVTDPKVPSIMILLGNETDPLDCLAVLLGNVSSNALHTDRLLLTPDKFMPDMGSVITLLGATIKNKKAVIVWDLLNINTEALKAFHNLCDRINPLVEEVLYIITVIADDYDKTSNPLEFVEKELFKKLSGKMKDDAIQPLITRITDGPILTVRPEPSITDCPLPKVT